LNQHIDFIVNQKITTHKLYEIGEHVVMKDIITGEHVVEILNRQQRGILWTYEIKFVDGLYL
jgi:hypothetical protein